MLKRSSGIARIFYPRLSKKEVIEKIRVGLLVLRKKLPVKQAILFGSYAKGRYTVASDIDLLIVYEGDGREDAYALSKRLVGVPGVEPHVYCAEEYEKLRQMIDRMTQGGIVLFP